MSDDPRNRIHMLRGPGGALIRVPADPRLVGQQREPEPRTLSGQVWVGITGGMVGIRFQQPTRGIAWDPNAARQVGALLIQYAEHLDPLVTWECPKRCGHSIEDHSCREEGCQRNGCHGHDGSDGPCDCDVVVGADEGDGEKGA